VDDVVLHALLLVMFSAPEFVRFSIGASLSTTRKAAQLKLRVPAKSGHRHFAYCQTAGNKKRASEDARLIAANYDLLPLRVIKSNYNQRLGCGLLQPSRLASSFIRMRA